MTLVSSALQMAGSRSGAKALLEEALKSFERVHSSHTDIDKLSNLDKHSQIVNVPIDETRALTIKMSPTYEKDSVNSVTLKGSAKSLVMIPLTLSERLIALRIKIPVISITLPSL